MGSAPLKTRREREREFRRNLILDAVERAFTDLGFAGASVEEIASRAEVAPATLYNLFGSKEELFAAVVERRMAEFLASVRGAPASGSPTDELARVVRAAFSYFDRHEASFHLYLATTHGVPWNIRVRLGERAHSLYQDFISYIESICRKGGGNRGKIARAVAVAFVGALNASIADWITQPAHAPAEKAWAEAWTVIRSLAVGSRK